MSVSFDFDQGKTNSVKISSRKIMLNKGQLEIFEKLMDCISNAMPSIDESTIESVLKASVREWEKEKIRPINEFRFIHANERMKSFDEIYTFFMDKLGEILVDSIHTETIVFLRTAVLTNYKDFLEAEGYVVDYTP